MRKFHLRNIWPWNVCRNYSACRQKAKKNLGFGGRKSAWALEMTSNWRGIGHIPSCDIFPFPRLPCHSHQGDGVDFEIWYVPFFGNTIVENTSLNFFVLFNFEFSTFRRKMEISIWKKISEKKFRSKSRARSWFRYPASPEDSSKRLSRLLRFALWFVFDINWLFVSCSWYIIAPKTDKVITTGARWDEDSAKRKSDFSSGPDACAERVPWRC